MLQQYTFFICLYFGRISSGEIFLLQYMYVQYLKFFLLGAKVHFAVTSEVNKLFQLSTENEEGFALPSSA